MRYSQPRIAPAAPRREPSARAAAIPLKKKCESACTRADVDDPIAIDEIKKFIADQDLKLEHRFIPKRKTPRPEKIAVIGAGPAGLSCAYFLAVEGYPVTVFEKQKALGGMLTMGIPSFRLSREIINSEIDVLKELGVEFKAGASLCECINLPVHGINGFLHGFPALLHEPGYVFHGKLFSGNGRQHLDFRPAALQAV